MHDQTLTQKLRYPRECRGPMLWGQRMRSIRRGTTPNTTSRACYLYVGRLRHTPNDRADQLIGISAILRRGSTVKYCTYHTSR